jgi:hypothetical protein
VNRHGGLILVERGRPDETIAVAGRHNQLARAGRASLRSLLMLRRLLAGTVVALTAAFPSSSAQTPGARVKLTGTVVVVNQQSDSVTLIDLRSMEAYRHVPVVGGPHEAAASPDGRSVVVTNYNKQGVGPQKALSVIALPGGDPLRDLTGSQRAELTAAPRVAVDDPPRATVPA